MKNSPHIDFFCKKNAGGGHFGGKNISDSIHIYGK